VDNTVLLDIILIFHFLILLINNNKLNKNTPQLTSKKTLPTVLGARCVYATLAWSLDNCHLYSLCDLAGSPFTEFLRVTIIIIIHFGPVFSVTAP